MIVYLARDIPAFVMYCVYGESRSSVLIEPTDSIYTAVVIVYLNPYTTVSCFCHFVTFFTTTNTCLLFVSLYHDLYMAIDF